MTTSEERSHNGRQPGDSAPNGKIVESVWDYPRPPRVELVEWNIQVEHDGILVVDAPWAHRVLETSQPPAYYVAPDFVRLDLLVHSSSRTFCEWKGLASYVDLVTPRGVLADAGWRYDDPTDAFAPIAGCYAFYAQKVDRCSVDGEAVVPNEGSFYGGWVTSNLIGPFKGAPGTAHW